MDKRALELQSSFFVMLIIAILIFGLGLTLAMRTFNKAQSLREDIDKKTEQEILSQISSGKTLSLGINRKVIKKGKSDAFALGIINKKNYPIKFMIWVENRIVAVNSENQDISAYLSSDVGNPESWTYIRRPTNPTEYITLEQNKQKVVPIGFKVPSDAQQGLYAFTIRVYYNDSSDTKICPSCPSGYSESSCESVCVNSQADKIYAEIPLKLYIEVP